MRSRVFQNEGLFKIWMWCLLKANHKGQWIIIKTGRGTTEVWIEPGQFIFGRLTAAKELKMKPSTVNHYQLGVLPGARKKRNIKGNNQGTTK